MNMNMNTQEQEAIEFGEWVEAQSPERMQLAFDRAQKEFDEQYISMTEVEDYMADEDFLALLGSKLSLLWTADIVWGLEHDGLATLEVTNQGDIAGTLTPEGDRVLQAYAESND